MWTGYYCMETTHLQLQQGARIEQIGIGNCLRLEECFNEDMMPKHVSTTLATNKMPTYDMYVVRHVFLWLLAQERKKRMVILHTYLGCVQKLDQNTIHIGFIVTSFPKPSCRLTSSFVGDEARRIIWHGQPGFKWLHKTYLLYPELSLSLGALSSSPYWYI